jgi:hypothetical protein
MRPTARIPVWTEYERKACCCPRHRAQNALGRLEQTGDNAGVDGAVVLLAAAAEA